MKFQSVEGSRVVKYSASRPGFISDFVVPLCVAAGFAIVFAAVWAYVGYRDVGLAIGTLIWSGTFYWRIRVCDARSWSTEETIIPPAMHDNQSGEPGFVVVDPNRARDEARRQGHDSEAQRYRDLITLAAQEKTSLKKLAPYGFSRREIEDKRVKLISWGIADWEDYKNKSWKLILPLDQALAAFQDHTAPLKWGE